MFDYDSEKKLLTVSKIPIAARSTVYEETDMYKSYKQYRDVGLEADIRDILLPKLNEILNPTGNRNLDLLWIDKVEVKYDNTSTYRGYEYYSAFVTFGGLGLDNVSKPFCLFKLPYMDKFSLLKREGKKYAMISEIIQDDDITFSNNELKIITKGGCFINLKENSRNPKMVFNRQNISSLDVMFKLAKDEGLNPEMLYQELVSRELCNAYKDEWSMKVSIAMCDTEIVSKYVDALKEPKYSLSLVRDRLNATLSIDRAKGKILNRDIELKNGEVIEAETIITSQIIKRLKKDAVNVVYVKDIPVMDGYVLARDIRLYTVRKGTELLPEIRDYLPAQRGNFLAKDVHFDLDNQIIIPPRTVVTKKLLEVLAFNGYTMVELSPSVDSSVIKRVPLESTIVGNRCFTKRDLGLDQSDEWVYVDLNGEYKEPSDSLTAYDLAAMISLYDKVVINEDLEVVAHRDLAFRKKIYMANENFHIAFENAASTFVSIMSNKFHEIFEKKKQLFGKPDEMESIFYPLAKHWWRYLYKTLRVIQPVDMSNPVAFYSSFAKVNTIVKDKNAITYDQHSLALGYYGKICPYETPSGKTMGVVGNKAIGCKIEDGVMKTSYYRVKHIGNKSFIDFSEKVWMAVHEEEKKRIADITSVQYDAKTGEIFTEGRILARVPDIKSLEKMTVSYINVDDIDLVNTDPNQTNGVVATTIPFQGADDSARVIFGLSMAKQAIALANAEVPIVMTSGFIDIPRMSTYFMIQAEYNGVVTDANSRRVVVQYDGFTEDTVYEYDIKEFNHDSVIIRELCVSEGDFVRAGDILVTSNFIKEGYLATGINCLVAYIPEGYNYEDGVFASEHLASKITSIGAKIETHPISKVFKRIKIDKIDNFRYITKGATLYRLKQLVGSGGEDASNYIRSKKIEGFIVDSTIEVDPETSRDKEIRVEAIAFNKMQHGDKLANRHGNKGVTTKTQENVDMPYLINGEIVDLCYNPAGVTSRMNIGQILECNAGLACYVLGIRIRTDSFNGASVDNIKMLLSYAWHLANDDDTEAVFHMAEFAELPENLHDHCRNNIGKIRSWKDSFNPDGTAWLYNPRTGKLFETPVVVGINYVYKLVHEAVKKAHARGGFLTERYIEKLSCPTKGSRVGGGQRFGYMELDALAAYGANDFIYEILNERGDNPVARNNLIVSRYHKGDEYMLDEETAIRRSTEGFVNYMEALGVHIDFEGELPNNTELESMKRKIYKPIALRTAVNVSDRQIKTRSLTKLAKEISSI
mgnify:FL=1